MGSLAWLTVPVSELEMGLPLRYDIFNDYGDLLATAGDEFSQGIKASWLQLGFDKVYAKVIQQSDQSSLMQPYDEKVLATLESNLKLAQEVIAEVARHRGQKQVVTSMEFNELTGDMFSGIQQDNSAALVVLARSLLGGGSDELQLIAERSARLSLLSMAIAFELGLVPSECTVVGTAAMLHDISLMNDKAQGQDEEDYYRQHPLISANIVDAIVGLNPKVSMAISQVHESPYGQGFPRGLKANRITPIARLINLADAYLTLTLQRQSRWMPIARNLHPADAIGYLMYQSRLGQFDSEMLLALIRATSVYPVGSPVILSDDSTGIVHRSSRTAGAKPIVQLATSKKFVDLRESNLTIRGPNRDAKRNNVLFKSQLNEIMWV